MLTPLGLYNHIAENMVNKPICVCSWNDHMKSDPHLGSTKKYRKICFEEHRENLMISDKPIIRIYGLFSVKHTLKKNISVTVCYVILEIQNIADGQGVNYVLFQKYL